MGVRLEENFLPFLFNYYYLKLECRPAIHFLPFLFNYYYLKLECRPALHFLLFSF